MSITYGKFGPAFPRAASVVYHLAGALFGALFRARGVHRPDGAYAKQSLDTLRSKLERGPDRKNKADRGCARCQRSAHHPRVNPASLGSV